MTLTFEEIFLPHLDAAFNLARWLTRNENDAQDVVQEAYLRALKSFSGFHGTDGRPWLLMIVRNTFYTWLKRNRPQDHVDLDEAAHVKETRSLDPEQSLIRAHEVALVREMVERLPIEYREIIVLRELEELSYREISAVAGIPLGTVMSRLARGRQRLQTMMRTQRSHSGVTEILPRYTSDDHESEQLN